MKKPKFKDPLCATTHERAAFWQAVAVVIAALLFFSYLERMPS